MNYRMMFGRIFKRKTLWCLLTVFVFVSCQTGCADNTIKTSDETQDAWTSSNMYTEETVASVEQPETTQAQSQPSSTVSTTVIEPSAESGNTTKKQNHDTASDYTTIPSEPTSSRIGIDLPDDIWLYS